MTEDLYISRYSVYEIIQEVTHIGVKNGKIGFFVSDFGGCYKSSNNRWFIKIPEEPRPEAFAFPLFERKNGGYYYGFPIFFY